MDINAQNEYREHNNIKKQEGKIPRLLTEFFVERLGHVEIILTGRRGFSDDR